MSPVNENTPELVASRGDAHLAERTNIIPMPEIHRNLYLIAPQAWRRATGLLTLSDYGKAYAALRHPRGNYLVPLPEDLIDGR